MRVDRESAKEGLTASHFYEAEAEAEAKAEAEARQSRPE